jgi:DNA-directed RNA polymerase, mitochondrial
MTKTYNVTLMGIKDQLASKFKKFKVGKEEIFILPAINKEKTVKINTIELIKIADIINKAIFKTYPSLDLIYSYFINMTKLLNKLEIPVIWLTPSGLEIVQNYYISKQNKIAINFAGRTKKMVIRDWSEKVDKSKQSQGIIPNIIHSLEASHFMNVIIYANENNITPVITVHDCFGTHPNKLESLALLVKLEYIILNANNEFLNTFHNRNKQNIIDNRFEILFDECSKSEYILLNRTKHFIPNIPKLGNLDLRKIIDSKYMIS